METKTCPVPYWDKMSTRNILDMIFKEHSCIIIPIGVIEAHGPLLPTGYDGIMANIVAHHTAEQIITKGAHPIIFNCMPYSGIVGATTGILGTIAYPAILATELLFVTIKQLVLLGCNRFFIINGDAGTHKSLMPFLFRATEERQNFFRKHDGILSLYTWFDGIENVGHASMIEHAMYTYLCWHSDSHLRTIAHQYGFAQPLDERGLKDLDGLQRTYLMPRREIMSWASLQGQRESFGVSSFSYSEYRNILDTGQADEIWKRQIKRITSDMMAIFQQETDI